MKSKVFSFFTAIFSKIGVWFDESLCGKIYNTFCAFCAKTYKTSFVRRFFAGSDKAELCENGIFSKVFSLPGRSLLWLQKKLSEPLNRLLEKSYVINALLQWQDVSVRFYGIICAVFSLLLLLFRESGKTGIFVLVFLFVVGVLLSFVKRSLRTLFGGSKIVTLLTDVFELNIPKKETNIPWSKTKAIVATLLGAVLAFLCIQAGFKAFVLITAGVIGLIFLFQYLSLGVFLAVVFSPVLPTMALVGISILSAFVLLVHVIKDKSFTFVKNSMNTAVIFFGIALIWGCINSFSFMPSIKQVLVHASFILFYFVVINTIRTKKQWLSVIKLFLLSAFVVAVYGVMQNFLGVNSTASWVDEEMFGDIEVRVYSFFNNPNVLGEFLVMTIPLTVSVMWGKMREEYKALFGFILLSMIACMIFTWSRGAWLGVFLACALLLVILEKRWVVVGVLGLLVLPLLLVLSGNTAILSRLLSVGNVADTSTAYRVSIWRAAISMIRDFWFSGIGIGSDAFTSVYPAYSLAGADFALHSHNLYLQVWIEMGVIGIASLLSVVLCFIKQVFSERVIAVRKTNNEAKMVIALGAGLLGFLFQGLTDYVWYNYKILMIFWIVLALGISGVNVITKSLKEGGNVL